MPVVGSLQYRHQVTSVQFCGNKYLVHNIFSGSGFKNLVNDLCRVCVDNGFNVAKNGLYPYTNNLKEKCEAQRFSCSHTFTLLDLKNNIGKSPTTVMIKTVEGRNDFIWKEGPILADAFVMTQNVHFCLACFWSQIFFIVNGLGNKTHINHIKKDNRSFWYYTCLQTCLISNTEEWALSSYIYVQRTMCSCSQSCLYFPWLYLANMLRLFCNMVEEILSSCITMWHTRFSSNRTI